MMDWFARQPRGGSVPESRTAPSGTSKSWWGTTEELWFDEYEHGGLPWDIPQKYASFSPHTKAGDLGKFKTPMLLMPNDLDFRCPIGQGHELFSGRYRGRVSNRK